MAKLKDIPKFDRPREKFLEKGADALTDSELLAILLGNGIKGTNVKVLSQKILRKFGDNLINASVGDLMQIQGIGQVKALQISSALALTIRIFNKQNSLGNLILSAQDAVLLVSDLKDKKQLLESIRGIGPATINVILSEFAQVQRFQNAKHLASFIGVAPRLMESGTSVRGRSRMPKIGRSQLRKAFFLPAMVALRYNPIIKSFGERLRASGKTKMQVIGAAMRKLIHIVYGVLKNNTPFNPDYSAEMA